MAGRKKEETAPVSARTLQRRAKEAQQKATQSAPVATEVKAKPKRNKPAARKLKTTPVAQFTDSRSAEVKAVDAKLIARMDALLDAMPPSPDALETLMRIRGMIGFSF